ncbi:hypothetical protein AB0D68_11015 [Streptomyces sp. NPDC048212]|uniref:hypothetical protein n=1 Tax=Streptomyces sp. NPDC048212 TaxID=3156658 RepID=UPI0033C27240
MQFKQGDTVMSSYTEIPGKVVHGPFIRAAMGHDAYLVELLEGENKGECSVWHSQDMKPAPRFKVGQKVTFNYSSKGEHFELVAGPFLDFQKDPFWVIKDQDGDHNYTGEKYMIPVV